MDRYPVSRNNGDALGSFGGQIIPAKASFELFVVRIHLDTSIAIFLRIKPPIALLHAAQAEIDCQDNVIRRVDSRTDCMAFPIPAAVVAFCWFGASTVVGGSVTFAHVE